MTRAGHASTVVLMLLLLHAVSSAQAQSYNWDATVNGGWSSWTHALSSDAIGFDNISDISFGSSALGGAQFGYWFTPFIGARLNGAYAESNLEQGGRRLFNNIHQWSGTADLLLRFARPRSRWSGTEFLPFIALGLGAQWLNPAGNDFALTEHVLSSGHNVVIQNGTSGVPFVCRGGLCTGPASPGFPGIGDIANFGDRTFFLKQTSTFMGLVSAGLDIRLAKPFAVRVEAGDRMWQAPIAQIADAGLLNPEIVVLDNSVGTTVHHLFITGGVSVLFGIHPPPPAVVALPAPFVPPPEPPPPPATETYTVCLVDPTITDGVRTVEATRNLRTGETTVVQDGRTVSLAAVTGRVVVAANADWYLRGAPFEIGSGPLHLLFVPTGSSQTLAASELSYIGTVNGLPVYVARTARALALQDLGPTTDLGRLAVQRPDVRAALTAVPEILIPVDATGCVFQSMVLQSEIGKGK